MSFSDSVSEILSKLAQMLGMKPSEARRMELMEQKLRTAKAANVDRIEAIKQEIRQLEVRALKKKKELDDARGDSKRVIAGEIERTFRDLDRLRGRESILTRNIDKLSMALSKLSELRAAEMQGMDEGAIDDLSIDAEAAFSELKAVDRAADGLESVRYEAPKESHVDTEQRMSEVEGTRETEPELSAETQRRLKALEADE